jgi:hypothetical protein
VAQTLNAKLKKRKAAQQLLNFFDSPPTSKKHACYTSLVTIQFKKQLQVHLQENAGSKSQSACVLMRYQKESSDESVPSGYELAQPLQGRAVITLQYTTISKTSAETTQALRNMLSSQSPRISNSQARSILSSIKRSWDHCSTAYSPQSLSSAM